MISSRFKRLIARFSVRISLIALLAPMIFVIGVVTATVSFPTYAGAVYKPLAAESIVGVDLAQIPAADAEDGESDACADDAPPSVIILDEKAPSSFVMSLPVYDLCAPWILRPDDLLFPISLATPHRPPLA